MRILYLYRQRLPAAAPQAVQILSTCQALACAGADVFLIGDLPSHSLRPDPARMLADYGLLPHPRLHLAWLSVRQPTLAGLEYRWRLLRCLLQRAPDSSSGAWAREPTVIYSRRAAYAAALLPVLSLLGQSVHLVHEWHYLSAWNARERGEGERARRLEALEARVCAGAAGHVVVSPGLEEALRSAYLVDAPVLVLPNGGPEPLTEAELNALLPRRTHPRLVYAGLFRRPADLDPLLDAVALLPPQLTVEVLGGDEDGSRLEETRRRASARGLNGRIIFTGPLSPAEARARMQTATLALATFSDSINMRHFACPLKILEYQSAGLPTISTDHPTVRSLIEHGRDAILVPQWQPERLRDAILSILHDPAEQRRLARCALERARTRTWQQRGERLLKWLREHLVDSPMRPPRLRG